MKIFALGEGSYSVDGTKKFIPFDPQVDNFRDRPGSLFIHVNPFLIQTATDLIVLDCGLGYKDTRGELILHQHIRNASFDPEDVTLVLMSHLHYDHSGGLVVQHNGKWEPSFPAAEHVIQRGEWETAFSSKSSSYHTEIFDVLQRSAHITYVEGTGQFKPGIRYELSGGHCQYHQVFWLEDGESKVFFGGDELPEPEQLIRRFKAKYDFDPQKAMELRDHYGKIAADEGWTTLFYHAKSNPVGNISHTGEHFLITPV